MRSTFYITSFFERALFQVEDAVFYLLKGDGNDGEPDAHRKLALKKEAKNWLELKNYGWFWVILENI